MTTLSSPSGSKRKGGKAEDTEAQDAVNKRTKLSWISENVKGFTTGRANAEATLVVFGELVEEKYLGKKVKFRVTADGVLKGKEPGISYRFCCQDNSAEVVVVGFREAAKLLEKEILVNRLYELENFYVKNESKQYPSGLVSGIELQLIQESKLTKLLDNGKPAFAPLKFYFKDYGRIQSAEKGLILDFVGILFEVENVVTVGKDLLKKRDLILTDKSKQTLKVTLWGKMAESFEGDLGTCVIVRKAVLKEFLGEKFLSLNGRSTLWMNPCHPEADQMLEWYRGQVSDVTKEEVTID